MRQPGRLQRGVNGVLSRLTAGLLRLKERTRVVRWPEGEARRFAVLVSMHDPSHYRLCLDAIEAWHPGSAVSLYLDADADRVDAAALLREFTGLGEITVNGLEAAAGAGPFDVLIVLHPYPWTSDEVLARLERLRRAARGIRARERRAYFRNLELWDESWVARLARVVADRIRQPVFNLVLARERRILGEAVAPALGEALGREFAVPCAHEAKFRVFDEPCPIDFCPDCGMGVTPRERRQGECWIEATYGASYALRGGFIGRREWEAHCAAMGRRLSEMLEALGFDPASGAGRRVLDAGCGYGRYARFWVRHGWRYTGADPSRENIRFAMDDLARWGGDAAPRVEFIPGDTLDPRVAARGPYAVIMMNHVLEHVPDPEAQLRQLRELAEPGGWLYLEVPHAVRYTWDADWRGYTNAEHLWDFTPAMLGATARAAGWRVLRVMDTPQPELYPYLALLARRL